MEMLWHFYLIGVAISIIGCTIYITIECVLGRKILFTSKDVWIGILFYTIISWIGFLVYCWNIYLILYKREV